MERNLSNNHAKKNKQEIKNTNFVVIFHWLLFCEGTHIEALLDGLDIKTDFDDLQITSIEAYK